MDSDTNKKQEMSESLNSPKRTCFSPKRRPVKMLYADNQLIKDSSKFSKTNYFSPYREKQQEVIQFSKLSMLFSVYHMLKSQLIHLELQMMVFMMIQIEIEFSI